MVVSIRDLTLGIVVGVGITLSITGCGDVEPGYTEDKVDCIDGCNNEQAVTSGTQGDAGPEGVRGSSGPAGVAGSTGSTGGEGAAGTNGSNGTDGATGAAGTDGYSVVTQMTPSVLCDHGGTTIVFASDANRNGVFDGGDSDVRVTDICNGAPGANGEPGEDAPPTQYSVTEMIDPCGDTPGVFDEVLLRLANGTILASFSDNANGLNTRLSVLIPGSFRTTDGSSCNFSYDGEDVVW